MKLIRREADLTETSEDKINNQACVRFLKSYIQA
jgi:hypothetical protein